MGLHHHDGRWPYEYGSDLHWLWGWGQRIEAWQADGRDTTEWIAAIFRPDTQALDALTRLAIDYPLAIKPIQDHLDRAERFYDRFCADQSRARGEDVENAIELLSARIRASCAAIAESQKNADLDMAADNVADSGEKFRSAVPQNAEVLRLAKKIKAEYPKNGTKRDITLEFTDGDDKKADSLLRQLRRFPHLLE